jgi:hypothetical protein
MSVAAATLLACDGNVRNPRGRGVSEGQVVMRDMVRAGRLDAPELREVSGVVPAATPGHFWVLNDSGNKPRLYVIDSTGRLRRTVSVRGVKNRDWEALGHGPCLAGEGRCLYIGDVGDNGARAERVRIIWLREPEEGVDAVDPDGTIEVQFADGPHDVEALYVAADTSVWLVTKRPATSAAGTPRPSRLYRIAPGLPSGNARVTTTRVAVADSVPVVPLASSTREWITDGSLSPSDSNGTRRLALLTYGAVYVLEADALTGRPGRLIARCSLPIRERTAEGITWLDDGRLLVMNEGEGAAFYMGRCP